MIKKYIINSVGTLLIFILILIFYFGFIGSSTYIKSDYFDGDTSTYISGENHDAILVNDRVYIEKCGIYGGSFNDKDEICSEKLRSDFAAKYEHTLLANINKLSSTFHHHFQLIFPASEYLRGIGVMQIESMY